MLKIPIEYDLLIHGNILADRLVKYKYYPITSPVFHLNEIKSILFEYLNDEENNKEIRAYTEELATRFMLYSQLKTGEADHVES